MIGSLSFSHIFTFCNQCLNIVSFKDNENHPADKFNLIIDVPSEMVVYILEDNVLFSPGILHRFRKIFESRNLAFLWCILNHCYSVYKRKPQL